MFICTCIKQRKYFILVRLGMLQIFMHINNISEYFKISNTHTYMPLLWILDFLNFKFFNFLDFISKIPFQRRLKERQSLSKVANYWKNGFWREKNRVELFPISGNWLTYSKVTFFPQEEQFPSFLFVNFIYFKTKAGEFEEPFGTIQFINSSQNMKSLVSEYEFRGASCLDTK
jgi:hypothetical protein